MTANATSEFARLPSMDRLLGHAIAHDLVARYGRDAVKTELRRHLDILRSEIRAGHNAIEDETAILNGTANRLSTLSDLPFRAVYNLTGTVLHTNLGRALLPDVAIDAVKLAAANPTNLEFDLETGKRGDRDTHVEAEVCHITGAEAATVVNNNAAAVILVLNTLALGREVPVSRGELVEIGGSFRIPDIMERAGCKLVEVGTTNRTHLHDFERALGEATGLVMKVHTSNYVIEGFTKAVPERELARLCKSHGIPFANDLGSGTLVDLERWGLPHEPTPMDALADGADIVTFSGDKLLGGPQAGIIVGSKALISRIKSNPLKRALRCDKMTIAALSAVLHLYRDPDRLADHLPALTALSRPTREIEAVAERLLPPVQKAMGEHASTEICDCESQIGSGALPTRTITSKGIAIKPTLGMTLETIAAQFRALPTPVIGRVTKGVFVLDMRCMTDEATFLNQLSELRLSA